MENQRQESMRKTKPAMAGFETKISAWSQGMQRASKGGKAGKWILLGKSTAQQTLDFSSGRTFSDL